MDQKVFAAIVKKEVALKVAEKETFTAYDITKTLRAWMNVDVDHQEVRNVVHGLFNDSVAMFNFNDYMRSTCTFADGTLVEVFHDPSVDPQDYIDEIDGVDDQSSGCDKSTCTCTDPNYVYDLEHENAILRNLILDFAEDASNVLMSL